MQSFRLKFLGVMILQGGGQISHFPIDFCMGLTIVQRYCSACDSCRVVGGEAIEPLKCLSTCLFLGHLSGH